MKDQAEKACHEYLLSLGAGEVRYEPNGPNTFPDFSLGTSAFFEVTRLVKSVDVDGGRLVIDEHNIPFGQSLQNCVEKFEATNAVQTRYLCFDVKLPFDRRRSLQELKARLRDDLNQSRKLPSVFWIDCNVKVKVVLGGTHSKRPYEIGSFFSRDETGWVIDDAIGQINDALVRKSQAALRHSLEFRDIHLVVSSSLTSSLDFDQFQFVRGNISKPSPWKGLVLLDLARPIVSRSIEFGRS